MEELNSHKRFSKQTPSPRRTVVFFFKFHAEMFAVYVACVVCLAVLSAGCSHILQLYTSSTHLAKRARVIRPTLMCFSVGEVGSC